MQAFLNGEPSLPSVRDACTTRTKRAIFKKFVTVCVLCRLMT